jgi:tRNA(Ile)-lysidine synthase TilS/MesJ
MIVDFLDVKKNKIVIARCPRCLSKDITEILTDTEVGKMFNGFECNICDHEFDEPKWVEQLKPKLKLNEDLNELEKDSSKVIVKKCKNCDNEFKTNNKSHFIICKKCSDEIK